MKKILIVEDELVVRSIYRRKYEMAGYEVETAEEGSAALKMLPTFKPDLVQVDIMMPGIDGVEVIRQIRAWPDFQNVPILVLSSFYRPDLAKEAWKAGASKCVSKMDCTPNLAIELVEQLLSGENTTFMRKQHGTIPLSKGAMQELKAPVSAPSRPPQSVPGEAPAAVWGDDGSAPKLKVDLNLPPSKGTAPTRPTFASEKEGAPAVSAAAPTAPGEAAKPTFFANVVPAPFKQTTRPTFSTSSPTNVPAAGSQPSTAAPAETGAVAGADFRVEIRQEFIKRSGQIQAELRDRTGALIKSKSITDQLRLLTDLESSVSSLASLSGITGYSRISHLSGALDALIKELHKKPNQMTASVLRTIAHAMDCMNVLFSNISRAPQELPQSILILAVDDEPISRRTVSVALGKANLRCIGIEDSKMALTLLKENAFDLIFLDAEMPGLNGFELCTELRKLPTNKNTPVIFVTSLTKFEIRAQSSLSGGNDLIAKPFLMMELAVKALTYLLKPPPSVDAKIRPSAATAQKATVESPASPGQ
jgi:CheY-like chemotaxis protein